MNVPQTDFRALIVDDDPNLIHAMGAALSSVCECSAALTGGKALDLMQRRQPDIVLLDMHLPDITGMQIMQRMKEDPGLSQIPVIMITASEDEDFHRRAFSLGAVDYLIKPVSGSVLAARVGAHLRMSAVQSNLRQESENTHRILDVTVENLQLSHEALTESSRALEVSNAKLQQFLRVASHDLREPLNAVTQFAGLLSSDYAQHLPLEGQEYLRHVLLGAHRMGDLLENIVLFTRLQSMPLASLVPVSLVAVMADVRSALTADERTAAKWNGVRVDPLPDVRGDQRMLSLLLQRLLSNALRFHAEGQVPKVHVHAETRGDEVMLHVVDEGIGIAPEFHEDVFKPFVRLGRRSELDGSGLGLTIAREIARHLGASLQLTSGLGQGTDVSVTLTKA